MGEQCLEHERRDAPLAPARRLLPRLMTASMLLAAAAAGALIGSRVPR